MDNIHTLCRETLKCPSYNFQLPVFTSFCKPFPWVSDGLMTCSKNQTRAKVMGYLFHDQVTEIVYFNFVSTPLQQPSQFVCLDEASCRFGEEVGRPPAKKQLGTEALSPTVLKELNPTNNHTSLEADPLTLEPSGKTPALPNISQLCKDPGARDPAKPCLES